METLNEQMNLHLPDRENGFEEACSPDFEPLTFSYDKKTKTNMR